MLYSNILFSYDYYISYGTTLTYIKLYVCNIVYSMQGDRPQTQRAQVWPRMPVGQGQHLYIVIFRIHNEKLTSFELHSDCVHPWPS